MKATAATVAARVDEILRIRLDGAKWWDIRQYVAEREAEGKPPWTLPEGESGLSERQIRNYCRAADDLIAQEGREKRRQLRHNRKAKLDALYSRCVNAGDFRSALAVLRELNSMDGLYPDPAEDLRKEVESLKRQLEEAEAKRAGVAA